MYVLLKGSCRDAHDDDDDYRNDVDDDDDDDASTNVTTNKSIIPGDVSPRMYKELAAFIAKPLREGLRKPVFF